jgi:hypothetical protein
LIEKAVDVYGQMVRPLDEKSGNNVACCEGVHTGFLPGLGGV